MPTNLKSRKSVRTIVYVGGAVLGSLGGFLLDKSLYPDGGTVLMKFGFVLGLCLAYAVLGPKPKAAPQEEKEE